jgi:hypothetical protein
MICIKVDIPRELNGIDDELKPFIIARMLFAFISSKQEI